MCYKDSTKSMRDDAIVYVDSLSYIVTWRLSDRDHYQHAHSSYVVLPTLAWGRTGARACIRFKYIFLGVFSTVRHLEGMRAAFLYLRLISITAYAHVRLQGLTKLIYFVLLTILILPWRQFIHICLI